MADICRASIAEASRAGIVDACRGECPKHGED